MANVDLSETIGFVDVRAGRGWSGASSLVEQNNYDVVNDLRVRLIALNAAYYTAARLDLMTKNDMQYALRTISDAAGIR
jgi:hypothetical protein